MQSEFYGFLDPGLSHSSYKHRNIVRMTVRCMSEWSLVPGTVVLLRQRDDEMDDENKNSRSLKRLLMQNPDASYFQYS